MTLDELQIRILDEIDTIANSPVIDTEEVKETIETLFTAARITYDLREAGVTDTKDYGQD